MRDETTCFRPGGTIMPGSRATGTVVLLALLRICSTIRDVDIGQLGNSPPARV
jgi:hypothetical protein